MTVIAYSAVHGQMACDSCWSWDGTIQTSATKITRLSSGAIIGEAGDADTRHVRDLLDKIRSPDKIPFSNELAALRTDYSALLVFPNLTAWFIDIACERERGWQGSAWPANRGVAAVGSGADIAIGAMLAHKTPREAVALVCGWVDGCRLPVHTMDVIAPKGRGHANRQ